MAFDPTERIAIRIHCGYPARGTSGEADALDEAMDRLSDDEVSVVQTDWLPRLAALDQAVVGAGIGPDAALDTARAAVWERNPIEMYERELLYYRQRVALCAFLDVPPGPGCTPPPAPVAPATPAEGGGSTPPATGPAWLPPQVLVV